MERGTAGNSEQVEGGARFDEDGASGKSVIRALPRPSLPARARPGEAREVGGHGVTASNSERMGSGRAGAGGATKRSR